MGLQLGFDGSVKLMGRDDASMHEAIRATLDTYRAYCADIEPSDGPYWRIVFAILSVHSPIGATFEAYKAVKLAHALGGMPGQAKLARIIGQHRAPDGVVLYQTQKARYILAFDAAWAVDSTPFTQNGDGDTGWRDRLRQNVLGLGWAKASFAVALSKPSTSDVCCIDSHMHQLLTGRMPGHISKRTYLALEDRVRDLATEYGVSAFTMQWLLWDAKRGISEPHSALKGVA